MFFLKGFLAVTAVSLTVFREATSCWSFDPTSQYYLSNTTSQETYLNEIGPLTDHVDVICNSTAASSVHSTSSSCAKGMCFVEAPFSAVGYCGYANDANGTIIDVYKTNILSLASNINGTGIILYRSAAANTTFTICLSQGTSGYFLLTQSRLCIDGILDNCSGAPSTFVTVCGVNTHIVNGRPEAVVSTQFIYANGTTAAVQAPMPSQTIGTNAAFALKNMNKYKMIILPGNIALFTTLFVLMS